MSISTYRALFATSAALLDAVVTAAIVDNDEQPFGPRFRIETPSGLEFSQVVVTGSANLPGIVESVTGDVGIEVDNTDANNPVVALDSDSIASLALADSALQPGSQLFNTGGLLIKAGGSALAKTANTVYGSIGAALITLAAGDMAALSGTVLTTKYNVFALMVSAAGAKTSAMGTEAATLAAVVFPTVPSTKLLLGFLIVHPTGTGSFVGGTTPLDDATVAPNTVYVNTVGVFVQPTA